MSIRLRIKRGTEQQILAGELAIGEMAFATDTKSLFIFNGVTTAMVGHVSIDVLANRPASGVSGRVFLDSGTGFLYIDTPVGWVGVGDVDKLDGDRLPIDWSPVNSTPVIVDGVTTRVDQLSSHLKGIDTAIALTAKADHSHSGTYAAVSHSDSHVTGGSDEIDADSLDIDWDPSRYRPTAVGPTGSIDHLASHLKGIDLALGQIGSDTETIQNTLVMMAWDLYSGDREFDDVYVDDFTDVSGIDGVVSGDLLSGNSSGHYDSVNSHVRSLATQANVTADMNNSQLDCSTWSALNSVSVVESTPGNAPGSAIYHAVSFDNSVTWKVFRDSAWISIMRRNGEVWQYMNAGSWVDASSNSRDQALIDATEQTGHQWTKAHIEVMTGADWQSSGGWSTDVNTIDWASRLKDGWSVIADGAYNPSEIDCVQAQSDGANVTESSFTASYEGWKCFNDLYGPQKRWLTSINHTTGWVTYDFGSDNRQVINKYRWLTMETDSSASPGAWQFQGSNDGSSWDTLHEGTNTVQTASTWIGWFTFNNSSFYRYYRMNVTANCGHEQYLVMDELEMVAAQSVAAPTFTKVTLNYDVQGVALSLVTKAWEASADDPVDAYCVIDMEPTGEIIMNTDLKAYVSTNDGLNWEQIALESSPLRQIGTHHYVRGDLYGLPERSDRRIRLRFTTHNDRELKLHSIAGGVRYHD